MKKILFIFITILFITGCTDSKGISLRESYTSCISPVTMQYERGSTFDSSNCESVIAFITKVDNATSDTKVKMIWIHENTDKIVLEKETIDDLSIMQYPTSSYVSDNFLQGKYIIKIYIDDIYNKSIEFTVN
jgi:hypothetical protein